MQLLAISPMLPELSTALAKKLNLEYEVLSDIGNTISRKYGLVFKLAESLQPIYSGFGIDIPLANGDTSLELPLPATYIIDQGGTIQLASMDVDYTVRLDPEDIIAFLDKMT